MLRFSRRKSDGTCAFADRYQFRFELRWRTVEGQPDLDRMFSDYMARLKDEGSMPDAQGISVAGCRGIQGRAGDTLTTQFTTYFPGPSCLVEPIFSWPCQIDRALQHQILSSLAMDPAWCDGQFTRWRALGMDLTATGEYSLTTCNVQPAAVRVLFTRHADGSGPSEQFQRLGMLDHWLRGSVEQWLLEQPLGNMKNVKVESTARHNVAGHEVITVHGTHAARRMGGFLKRTCPYQAAAWTCPEDGRLYSISLSSPEPTGGEELALAGRRLVCCERIRQSAGSRD